MSCCAINCKPATKKGRTFHTFPLKSQPDVARQWVLNMNRLNWTPLPHSVLCSDHFEQECFDRTGQTVRIKAGAVPTLFSRRKIGDATTTPRPILPKEVAVGDVTQKPSPFLPKKVPHNKLPPRAILPKGVVVVGDVLIGDVTQTSPLEAGNHQFCTAEMTPLKENSQMENAAPRVNEKTLEFHNYSAAPTIVNVASYPQEKWFSDLSQFDGEPIICGKKCRDKISRMLRQNKRLKVKIKNLQKENRRLIKFRCDVGNLNEKIAELRLKNSKLAKHDPNLLNETKRRLVEGMFGRQSKSQVDYHPQLLNDTLKLRRISRPAYNFVRKQFQLPIPSDHVLRKYLAEMNGMVGGSGADINKTNDLFEEIEPVEVFSNSDHQRTPLQEVINETNDALVVAADVETVEVVSTNSERRSLQNSSFSVAGSKVGGRLPNGQRARRKRRLVVVPPLEDETNRACEFLASNVDGNERMHHQVIDETDKVCEEADVETVEFVSLNAEDDEQMILQVIGETEKVRAEADVETLEFVVLNAEDDEEMLLRVVSEMENACVSQVRSIDITSTKS